MSDNKENDSSFTDFADELTLRLRRILVMQSGHTGLGWFTAGVGFCTVVYATWPDVKLGLAGIVFLVVSASTWGLTYSLSFTLWGLSPKHRAIQKMKVEYKLRQKDIDNLRDHVLAEHCRNRTIEHQKEVFDAERSSVPPPKAKKRTKRPRLY